MKFSVLASQILAFQIPLISLESSASFCSSANDIFIPESLFLKPDPPKRGEKLFISLKGNLTESIVSGSVAHVKVKLGFIQLLDSDFDLCEEITRVEKKCPLEKGPLTVNVEVDIPIEVPPGHYRIHVEAYLPNTKPISCIDGDFRM